MTQSNTETTTRSTYATIPWGTLIVGIASGMLIVRFLFTHCEP